jgi:uncharacterized protein YjiS (DUF1127 family)
MSAAQITDQITDNVRWQAHDTQPRGGILALLKAWWQRAYERQELLTLNDQMLRDIGITRCDAMREADKPFWRP